MSKVLVTDTHLSDIASAIRVKNGESTRYKPGEMAQAIRDIPSGATLESLSVTQNGTYTPGTGVDGYNSVSVNVPNSYSQSDEGKVVSSGALVAQTARSAEITQNGTYDTTANNSVMVNVSGGSELTHFLIWQVYGWQSTTGNIDLSAVESNNGNTLTLTYTAPTAVGIVIVPQSGSTQFRITMTNGASSTGKQHGTCAGLATMPNIVDYGAGRGSYSGNDSNTFTLSSNYPCLFIDDYGQSPQTQKVWTIERL